MDSFMSIACQEALQGIQAGDGGPFGAVVVKDNKVIAKGHNMVLVNRDSTAHAEIVAIRKAEQVLGTHSLEGCKLYATCYPCPMCLGAIMWARIDKVYYGATPEEAAAIGFDDKVFYENIINPNDNNIVVLQHIQNEECTHLFRDWENKMDKVLY